MKLDHGHVTSQNDSIFSSKPRIVIKLRLAIAEVKLSLVFNIDLHRSEESSDKSDYVRCNFLVVHHIDKLLHVQFPSKFRDTPT